jgi:DNA-binding CsgD family transcriptional regulator
MGWRAGRRRERLQALRQDAVNRGDEHTLPSILSQLARIEAKIALGDRREAQALLEDLEQVGAALQRPWVLAVAGRCRGLLSAADGDLGASYRAIERALELHGRLGEPFEHGRTLLVLGSVQRRDRKKSASRESLRAALEIFDTLGAAVWASRTRAELARVGGRAPAAGLTPTEERIAELIASGHTYQETADALFISPKTVQWNLSKIYRKLGIRSRAELAARLAAERNASGDDGDAALAERPVPN